MSSKESENGATHLVFSCSEPVELLLFLGGEMGVGSLKSICVTGVCPAAFSFPFSFGVFILNFSGILPPPAREIVPPVCGTAIVEPLSLLLLIKHRSWTCFMHELEKTLWQSVIV